MMRDSAHEYERKSAAAATLASDRRADARRQADAAGHMHLVQYVTRPPEIGPG